jgi:cytochrome c oxidase cbb3-type subunit 1
MNALIYGFAMQAGLGVLLWMLAHLGRTRLQAGPPIIMGAILWNMGVSVGILGILAGDSTGYQWLEMPRYGSMQIFVGYLLIGVGAMLTLHNRRERRFSSTQLFALAALFWFAWIYATAQMLLVAHPVRGALQFELNTWYVNNLKNVWFAFIGLGAAFYFIPKFVQRPLYSHYTSTFIFWTLTLFGSWAAVPPASPLPAWMPTISGMGAFLTLVPVLAAASNVRWTMRGKFSAMKECRELKFFWFGALAYILAGIAGAVMLLSGVSRTLNFTWFIPAQTELFLYGFVAITLFGAIYHIVPRLLGIGFPKPGMICLNFLLSAIGVLIYVLPLAVGGIKQGHGLNDASKPFAEVMLSMLMFLRVSTMGDLLMALGNVLLLVNLLSILSRAGKTSASAAWAANTKDLEARA